MNYTRDYSARTFLCTWEELTTYIHNWLKVINIALFLIYFSTLHSFKKICVQKLPESKKEDSPEVLKNTKLNDFSDNSFVLHNKEVLWLVWKEDRLFFKMCNLTPLQYRMTVCSGI